MRTEDSFDEIYFDDYPDDTTPGNSDPNEDDDDPDDPDVEWEWLANDGACAICHDLAQETHESEPDVPHETCNCTPKKITKGKNNKCKREYSVEINYAEIEPVHTSVDEVTFLMRGPYTVHCPDGTDIEGEVEVEFNSDDVKIWREMWGEMARARIMEEIDNAPENQCEPCERLAVG